MKRRNYINDRDILLLQDFTAKAIEETGGCGYLHPGDIPHHFFSGTKGMDHQNMSFIWEDENGVAGWILADPPHKAFDAQVRPDLRGGEFEREVVQFAEEKTLEFMTVYGIESDVLWADAQQKDKDRAQVLLDLGWKLEEKAEYVLNRRALDDIPEPQVAEGYSFRTVRGLEEADAVAKLHSDVFKGSNWTGDQYRTNMKNPGYSPDREYLAVDDKGNMAAFTVTWVDELNRSILFEPVGTHPDHRRKGLARALMFTAMKEHRANGIKTAYVQNEGANEASKGLYLGMGFVPWQHEDCYGKKLKK